MSKAVAFLAGLGAGYLDGKRKKAEDERQAARDQRETELYEEGKADRAAARATRQQEQDDKNALRTAGSDVAVTEVKATPMPAEAANPGALASSNPTVGGYKAGANQFADKGVAATDAAAQSTPAAKRARVMGVMESQGNFAGADQLRNSAITTEAAQMALDKGKRDEANQIFDTGIKKALQEGGPNGLAQFMSDSAADGKGGAVKFQAVTSPDGKSWQMHRVAEDGSVVPFGQAFSTDEGGMATAGLMLSRSVGDDKKVAHMMSVQEASRKAKHDSDTLTLDNKKADETARHNKALEQGAREQRAMTERHQKEVLAGKAKAGDPIKIELKDMRDFEGDLDKYIKDQFSVKDGADDKERAAINAQATSVKALGSAIFQSNASIGIPLTAGTVLQAVELAKDRKNVQIVHVGGVAREAVIVNSQPVITSGPLEKRAPPVAPAAKTASPSAAPAVTSVKTPAPQAPPTPNYVDPNSPAARIASGNLQVGVGWK